MSFRPRYHRGLSEYCSASSISNQTTHDGTFQREVDKELSDMLLGRNLNDHCGDEHGTPLVAVASHGLKTYVQLFLDCGADPNVYGGGTYVDECGNLDPFWHSALSAASYSDRNLEIQLLLERGASVDFEGFYHWSALGEAANGRECRWLNYFCLKEQTPPSRIRLDATSRS